VARLLEILRGFEFAVRCIGGRDIWPLCPSTLRLPHPRRTPASPTVCWAGDSTSTTLEVHQLELVHPLRRAVGSRLLCSPPRVEV